MAKKRKGKKKRTNKAPSSTEADHGKTGLSATGLNGNYVPSAAPGCHVAHFDAPWLLGISPFDLAEFGLDAGTSVPDISVDPETHMMSLMNSTDTVRSYYVSLGNRCYTADQQQFAQGDARDEKGQASQCTTFVVVTRPKTIVDVCYIELDGPLEQTLDLHSDVTTLTAHPAPEAPLLPERVFRVFPLEGPGPWVCTQGCCGHFTHFYPGTFHALDLACAVGTPVLSVGNGTVRDIKDHNTVSGIHVSNLFKWNSIMVAHDDGLFVEYVHIQEGSALVSVGDRVVAGQVICRSGDVGFCPEPHLHIQVHVSAEANAPTVPFGFLDHAGVPFVPQAGQACSAAGLVSQEAGAQCPS